MATKFTPLHDRILVRRVEEQESGYYVISWTTENSRGDEFRPYKISVTRPGYRVSGPRGYFGEKPFGKMDDLEREARANGLIPRLFA